MLVGDVDQPSEIGWRAGQLVNLFKRSGVLGS